MIIERREIADIINNIKNYDDKDKFLTTILRHLTLVNDGIELRGLTPEETSYLIYFIWEIRESTYEEDKAYHEQEMWEARRDLEDR